jgi:hypothetical protein
MSRGSSEALGRLRDAWPAIGVGVAVAANALWIAALAYAVSFMF